MIKEFTPYQEALELKELEFDEPCFGYYEDNNLTITFPSTSSNGWKWVGNSIIPAKNTKAPTYSQAFRWFREKYDLLNDIGISASRRNDINKWMYSIIYLDRNTYTHSEKTYNTYEEAELACLKKLIQIVKENKQ